MGFYGYDYITPAESLGVHSTPLHTLALEDLSQHANNNHNNPFSTPPLPSHNDDSTALSSIAPSLSRYAYNDGDSYSSYMYFMEQLVFALGVQTVVEGLRELGFAPPGVTVMVTFLFAVFGFVLFHCFGSFSQLRSREMTLKETVQKKEGRGKEKERNSGRRIELADDDDDDDDPDGDDEARMNGAIKLSQEGYRKEKIETEQVRAELPSSSTSTNKKQENEKEEEVYDPNIVTRIGQLTVFNKVLGYGSSGTIVFEGEFNRRKVAVKRMLKVWRRDY